MERLKARWLLWLASAALAPCIGWGVVIAWSTPDYRALDLLLTRDQQGVLLMRHGEFAAAASTFDDPQWQGVALYRAGKFKEAASRFALANSADARYDQGTALAASGRLDEALAVYDAALRQRPGWAEAVFNRAVVAKALAARSDDEARTEESRSSMKNAEPQDAQMRPGERAASAAAAGAEPQGGGQASKANGPGAVANGGNTSADTITAGEAAAWMRTLHTTPAEYLRRKFAAQQSEAERREAAW